MACKVDLAGSTLLANRTILAVLSRLNFDRAWFSWKACTTQVAAAFGTDALDEVMQLRVR